MYTNYTEDKTDGYNILGVKNVNVAVDAADYPAYVALNPTFKISRSVPAQYKTVTIVDGKAVYSATNFNVVDTVTDATATLKTGSTWGDYEIDVTEHSTAYIRNSRSDEGFAINAYIQGTILETESGLKVGMEFLQSMWVQPWEISFNVSPESTLNAHIAGWDNLDELSKLVGEKVTKIIFIMPDSTYIYEFDGIYIKPVYPEQADFAASFTAGSAEVAISGVPGDLEDVTVTITCGSGRGATTVANAVEIRDGKVTMDSAYDDTQTYTVKVSSSNYADLVAAVPVNSTQVTQLTQLVEQAKALIDDGTAANDSGLIEHYEEAQALLAHVDYTKIDFDRKQSAVTLPPDMEIDLGSVAKGYTGDQILSLLREADVTSALLNLGGNVQALGSKPDGSPWRIGVQNPLGDGYIGVLEVTDQAVITSGGYERYFVEDGKTYWHIIDPATGAPAHSGLISVTIIGGSGLMCDGLSTALFVMGLEDAAQFWRETGNFEAVFVTEDGQITITEGLTDRFSLEDESPFDEVAVLYQE